MKRIIAVMMACLICTTVAISLSGCGEEDKQPGYVIEATEPDLENSDFGFFIIDDNSLLITKYKGNSKNIVIPETHSTYSVTTIGRSVFNGSDITSVEIPDTVTEIQDYAFFGCRNLENVKMSKNLKTLGTNVFNLCSKLESIEIPATLEDMGMYTFSASGLKSVTIPESDTLNSISHFVFYQCPQLTDVKLPSTVTFMEPDVFEGCKNKVTITGAKDSYAETYAKKYNLTFKAEN